MQGLKINECGDQIVPIPIQRNNCIESVRLRKEILVNSAKMQESVQPLPLLQILKLDKPACLIIKLIYQTLLLEQNNSELELEAQNLDQRLQRISYNAVCHLLPKPCAWPARTLLPHRMCPHLSQVRLARIKKMRNWHSNMLATNRHRFA